MQNFTLRSLLKEANEILAAATRCYIPLLSFEKIPFHRISSVSATIIIIMEDQKVNVGYNYKLVFVFSVSFSIHPFAVKNKTLMKL